MNAVINEQNLDQYMQQLGEQARAAAAILANAEPAQKNNALLAIADALISERASIKSANQQDLRPPDRLQNHRHTRRLRNQ